MGKISDFTSSRAGRPTIEQRWMEGLARALQPNSHTPTFRSSLGTVAATPSTDDFYLYFNINRMCVVNYSRLVTLSGATSGAIFISLPVAPVGRIAICQSVLALGIQYRACLSSSLSGVAELAIVREDGVNHDIGTQLLYGSFFYFTAPQGA